MKRLLPVLMLCAVVLAPGAGAQRRRPHSICADDPPASARAKEFEVSPLETRVLGQHDWLRGGPAAVRIIVTNHLTGSPVRATVGLSLAKLENGKPAGQPIALYTGQTNGLGTLDAQFSAPAESPGPYQLAINVDSPLGKDKILQPVQLAESMQLLLTADKPLYQPGQIMHMRALALDMATRQALAERPITFEVEDARGNKVFKQRATLSRFGIASADFALADEVNMGVFTLRAVLPEGQSEKKVRVERYVLPKFKIALTTEKPYYLPGEEVKGTLKANYFFGKPVADGQVTLEFSTIDIGVTKLTEMKDSTDAAGVYHFHYTLPDSFVGQPFEQGKAVVELHATLKDKADHKQEANLDVPVVKDPISLVTVAESRSLVPDVENRVYIAAATPDGSPLKKAAIEATASWPGIKQPVTSRLTTDDLGLATFKFTPVKGQPVTLMVKATDANGHTATTTQQLTAAPRQEGIILRPDKTMAKVGDRLNLVALSSVKGGTLYLDVIRDKQTILTRAEPMEKGEARFVLPLSNDMTGTLEIHAYKILPNEDIIRDSKIVVVSPADDLNISVTADKTQYRPGDYAVLRFSVQDQRSHPVQAALGLAMVDDSVFALSELQPGLEKIYFTLEKDLMEPRYEIHGLKPANLLLPHPAVLRDEERQRAAALLFAAVPARTDFEYKVDTFQERWAKVEEKAVEEMMQADHKIVNAVQKYRQDGHGSLTAEESLTHLVEAGYLRESDLLDPWGHFYKSDLQGRPNYDSYFTLSSAGPDGKWGTNDDIAGVSMYGWYQSGNGIVGRGFGGRPMMFGMAGGGMGGFGGGGAQFAVRERVALPMALAAAPQDAPAAGLLPPGVNPNNITALDADQSLIVHSTASISSRSGGQAGGGGEPARVRSYFPETMYWNPALITDDQGHAELNVSLADSITTWRLSMMANTTRGQLGSATAPVKVFQDFFVDIDLPISLTQHDRVEIPIAVYNYLPGSQQVTLTLKKEPWFTLEGEATRTIKIDAGQVSVVYYPIVADTIGRHALQVTAKGSTLSDAIRRQIDVTPDGKEIETTINDRLEKTAEKSVSFPQNAIQGASSLWVKLYPGTFSQVVEGLDGILRMPGGCFEQTSSSTYPDLLALDYMKRNKRINPELQMKAEDYINVGYQRLVTFECKSGGFSWFGDEPAHQILTAYGLLEFSDMSKVHDVDPNLIARTQQWLAGRQQQDGSWEEKNQGIAEGIINRQTGALRTTAYVAWALAESGYKGPQVGSGTDYVKAHLDEAKDPYTLAVILNLLTKVDRDGATSAKVANSLIGMAKVTEKTAYWQADTQTFTGAEQRGADLETTGLAAYGLSKWGRNAGFTNKVLTYLVQSKDSFGTWESTQGTVWSMKALLFASQNGVGGGKGTVTILANGQKAGSFKITPEDSDVMRQVSLPNIAQDGSNAITLQYEGDGSLLYQIVGRAYVPWNQVAPPAPEREPLSLQVAYDKTTLAQDDTATVTVTIHNNTDKIAEMPLIDVGVPPGFTVDPEKLDAAVQAKTISKYTLAARQIIVYLEKLDPNQTITLTYQIKARYPLKARTPLSKVYPYYNPEKVAFSTPQDITVRK